MKPPRREKEKEKKEGQMKRKNKTEIQRRLGSQQNQEQQEAIEEINSETKTHKPDTIEQLQENGWAKKKTKKKRPRGNNTGNK